MNPQAKATIQWIPASEGGRKQPPSGPRYLAIVQFDEDRAWPNEKWDLVLELTEAGRSDLESKATISFLGEAAPHHLLKTGAKFSLFEGLRTVARGDIVG
jgi:hypothetical protein